ncbi:MAG TPA: SDR family oxidoreductase [Ottowia sp.]|uniref:SDR family oxidoreductase n=1 Tax=Ottowia sp. TaxID=1898956 RepID=UPI002BDDD631|nr:SDR family oxidoreductase [Ottowia sp.]HMN20862.1 SDR family oxidoreductase [Ottowia sp.]
MRTTSPVEPPLILITGATGQIGGAVLSILSRQGQRLRALARGPAPTGGPEGVQWVQGDYDQPASLAAALDGVDVLLLTGRDNPQAVAQGLRVLDAARAAGVRHVVRLSALGARADSPIALMREHAEVDAALRASGMAWTLVQPHLYMQNLLRAAEAVRRDGVLAAPMGRQAFPLVDTRDVAAAAAVILRDVARHAGRTHVLTGPAPVDYAEVAATLGRALGRTVTYEAVPPTEYEQRLLAAGMPGWRAFDLAHIASAYGEADHAVRADLGELLGHAPGTLARFVADHVAVFAGVAADDAGA